jgi:hypothetical protein
VDLLLASEVILNPEEILVHIFKNAVAFFHKTNGQRFKSGLIKVQPRTLP